MTEYWVTSPKMTLLVKVSTDNVIEKVAPVAEKFIGQPLESLVAWMERKGKVRLEEFV